MNSFFLSILESRMSHSCTSSIPLTCPPEPPFLPKLPQCPWMQWTFLLQLYVDVSHTKEALTEQGNSRNIQSSCCWDGVPVPASSAHLPQHLCAGQSRHSFLSSLSARGWNMLNLNFARFYFNYSFVKLCFSQLVFFIHIRVRVVLLPHIFNAKYVPARVVIIPSQDPRWPWMLWAVLLRLCGCITYQEAMVEQDNSRSIQSSCC